MQKQSFILWWGAASTKHHKFIYLYYKEAWNIQLKPSERYETWWRHQMETFFALLALCVGNSPVPVNSPHKGQWRGALMFSLIYAWINDWVNNREAGDLRRRRGHYDYTVMNIVVVCLLQYQYRFLVSICPFERAYCKDIGCIRNVKCEYQANMKYLYNHIQA